MKELSDFVSPTAHENMKIGKTTQNSSFLKIFPFHYHLKPFLCPSYSLKSRLNPIINYESLKNDWMNNREIRILLSQLCAAACVEFLCQSAVDDRPGPAGPSLTLGQSNRSAVPTALTYVNFWEAVLGDFRIWEIHGDFWIWETLETLANPRSVQPRCGPIGSDIRQFFGGNFGGF